MMVLEPVGADNLRQLFNAASMAYNTPEIGRQLYGLMRQAGLTDDKCKSPLRSRHNRRSRPGCSPHGELRARRRHHRRSLSRRRFEDSGRCYSRSDLPNDTPQFVVSGIVA